MTNKCAKCNKIVPPELWIAEVNGKRIYMCLNCTRDLMRMENLDKWLRENGVYTP